MFGQVRPRNIDLECAGMPQVCANSPVLLALSRSQSCAPCFFGVDEFCAVQITINIVLGNADMRDDVRKALLTVPEAFAVRMRAPVDIGLLYSTDNCTLPAALDKMFVNISGLAVRMQTADFGERYESHHALLFCRSAQAIVTRCELLANNTLPPLPPPSQAAEDQLYLDTASNIGTGLGLIIQTDANSADQILQQIWKLWVANA
eukprot:TRINITY_DN20231_c0_g1_i1.p1 TRINITY_DN20231_c0_g1~~TRINITY_DN20231_c0_g1_i1.p1  ORF type:complete len:205 (-),score=15.84 TRINITY_DN20231_c0_g1_i1:159-773(-)